MKLSIKKKNQLKAQTEEGSKQKELLTQNILIPQAPITKKQIMRNNTGIKKIPSTSYTSSSSMNKIIFPNTINYSIKEENENFLIQLIIQLKKKMEKMKKGQKFTKKETVE